MTLFELIIQQAAQGTVKPHQLIASIKAGELHTAGNRGARFTKTRPGVFRLELFEEDMTKPADTTEASSPVEAKLSVIDWLIEGFMASEEPDDDEGPAIPPAPRPRARR